MNFRVYLLSFILVATAAYLAYYRTKVLGVSLSPEMEISQWQVDVVVTADSTGRQGTIELELPSPSAGAQVVHEAFSAKDFSFAILETDGVRRAVWNSRKLPDGAVQATYQVMVKPSEKIRKPTEAARDYTPRFAKLTELQLEKLQKYLSKFNTKARKPAERIEKLVAEFRTADSPLRNILSYSDKDSSETKTRLLARVFEQAGYIVVVRKGLLLGAPTKSVPFHYWLQVKQEAEWVSVHPDTFDATKFSLIPWGINGRKALTSTGLKSATLSIAATPLGKDIQELRETREQTSVFWRLLSLDTLPVTAQTTYRLILLIPLGGFLLAFLRSIVGVRTFGTFMPVLIALSFREMPLGWGLLLFTGVVSIGLFFRALFSHLQLLLVPRLAAVLTVVILIVLATGIIAYDLGYESGLSVTLFPIIIITMTIERMSLIWEELGGKEAIKRFTNSVASAVVLYLAIFTPHLEYLLFTFPEMLLVVLALTLLLGRYTGYRLSELYRFRSFGKQG